MNETELILLLIGEILHDEKLINKISIHLIANYFNLSHTAIYKMMKNDRITIKFFKLIKTDELLKHINISDDYIINKILMGL
jgi:hypothetical protein